MSNAQLAKYKQHLQRYVFAAWAPPDDLKEWVRMFERVLRSADLGEEEPDDAGLETTQGDVEGDSQMRSFCVQHMYNFVTNMHDAWECTFQSA